MKHFSKNSSGSVISESLGEWSHNTAFGCSQVFALLSDFFGLQFVTSDSVFHLGSPPKV